MGPRLAVLGVGDACGHPHWGLRLWGHEALYWVGETHAGCATGELDWVGGAHAGPPTGAFGAARYGAAKRCTG
eukprot:3572939-Pyramimonas_sp.AAC.1